jgi:hypothetical protein
VEKRLIGGGVLAGVVGGLLAFVFARIFAEPQIQAAIDYESARDRAQEALDRAACLPAPAEEAELFTRTVQANLGLGLGVVLFGAAMGALFAVAYIYCVGRTGRIRPRNLAPLVAGAAFLGTYFVPFLKYPANPPAIGHADTSTTRGTLYLVMVVASVAFLALATWLGQRLQPRFGTWNAALLAGAAFVVAVGIVMLLLPELGHLHVNEETYGAHATETPQPLRDDSGQIVFAGFPADVLAAFRLYSVGAQVILWTAIALVFAPIADRLLTRDRDVAAHEDKAPATA